MTNTDALVSICLPVRNAGQRLTGVVESVLAQDHPDIEMVISDNGSTDDTEDVCRALAAADDRIKYHRQPENIGLLANFNYVAQAAAGTYFRWIGDDDRLAPNYVSRCLQEFAADPRLIMVTTQIEYGDDQGGSHTVRYDAGPLQAEDPVDRMAEMLRLLNESRLVIDPVYALMRREPVLAIPRHNYLREDEVFAVILALTGPWGHVSEVLAQRGFRQGKLKDIARRLDLPRWQAHASNELLVMGLLRSVREAGLTPEQQSRARAAVYRMYARRQAKTVSHRSRKLLRIATGRR